MRIEAFSLANLLVFRFVLDVGMISLTVTTIVDHMETSLNVLDFDSEPEEVELINRLN